MDDVTPIRTLSEFVGRADELARLESVLGTASGGTSAAVLVGGDAGVGKTRLGLQLVGLAERSGAVVAVGRCVDLGAGGLPYLPFTDALVALAGHPAAGDVVRRVAADRPALRRLTGRADDAVLTDDTLNRLPLFDAVVDALRTVGEQVAPVLLVLEDLHWADASTRDLLRFLLARLSDDRLLVVGTYRTDELHRRHPLRALLAELVRLPRVERMELRPFDESELRAYLWSLHGGAVEEAVVRDIGRRSEGNAFYAEELLAAAADDPAGGSTAGLPGGLADVLLTRLERLSEPVQHIARVASVAGRRVPDQLLRDACERPADQVHEALREAIAHQLLAHDGTDRFTFRHALMQEAVYADLLPGERVRLHARYAELLAAAPESILDATAADLARHYLEAHDLAGALGAWLRAARAAECRSAPADATAHYEQALQLWPAVGPEQRPPGVTLIELGLAAAAAASQAGDSRRAATLARSAARQAADGGDPRTEAEARQRLALYLYYADHATEAMEQVRRVYALLEGTGPAPARVWVATVEARLMGGSGDGWHARREGMLRARGLVETALAEARELGMVAAEADLLIILAGTDGMISGPDAAADRLEQAGRLGAVAQDPGIALRVAYNLGVNLLDVGDLAGSATAFAQGLADAERAGLSSSPYAVEARTMLAQALTLAGDWDQAIATVTRDRPRLPAREALFLTVPVLPVHAARDPAGAIRRSDELEGCDQDFPIFWHQVLVPRADALIWLGDLDGAVVAIRRTLQSFERLGRHLIMGGLATTAIGLAALADAAELSAAHGTAHQERLEQGRAWLAHARDVAAHGPTKLQRIGPEGTAWLLRAEAEATRLNGEHDVAAWRAAHLATGFGHVYEQARTGRRLAEALLAGGGRAERDEAAGLLSAAHATAERLGARPLRDAVAATARRYRLPVGTGPAVAPSVLTPREQQVMRLVAEGLTNREIGTRLFISEKTASVHVSNVLAKLGASGRAEAVALGHRRGLLGEPGPDRPDTERPRLVP